MKLRIMYPLIHRRVFYDVSFLGLMASCEGLRSCNSMFGHYVKLASKPVAFPGGSF